MYFITVIAPVNASAFCALVTMSKRSVYNSEYFLSLAIKIIEFMNSRLVSSRTRCSLTLSRPISCALHLCVTRPTSVGEGPVGARLPRHGSTMGVDARCPEFEVAQLQNKRRSHRSTFAHSYRVPCRCHHANVEPTTSASAHRRSNQRYSKPTNPRNVLTVCFSHTRTGDRK